MSKLRARCLENRGSSPGRGRHSSLRHSEHTGFVVHTACNPVGTDGYFPSGKPATAWRWTFTSMSGAIPPPHTRRWSLPHGLWLYRFYRDQMLATNMTSRSSSSIIRTVTLLTLSDPIEQWLVKIKCSRCVWGSQRLPDIPSICDFPSFSRRIPRLPFKQTWPSLSKYLLLAICDQIPISFYDAI